MRIFEVQHTHPPTNNHVPPSYRVCGSESKKLEGTPSTGPTPYATMALVSTLNHLSVEIISSLASGLPSVPQALLSVDLHLIL